MAKADVWISFYGFLLKLKEATFGYFFSGVLRNSIDKGEKG